MWPLGSLLFGPWRLVNSERRISKHRLYQTWMSACDRSRLLLRPVATGQLLQDCRDDDWTGPFEVRRGATPSIVEATIAIGRVRAEERVELLRAVNATGEMQHSRECLRHRSRKVHSFAAKELARYQDGLGLWAGWRRSRA